MTYANVFILIFLFCFLTIFITLNKFSFHIEKEQDLNLDKEFKTKEHFFYEKCSICGEKLKHARFGIKGDVMRCTVECKGKTTWYCKKCAEEYLDKKGVYQSPFDYNNKYDW